MVTLTIDQYSFHDGTLFEIEQTGRDLIISMESSCIGPEEISNHTLLSIWGTLRGQLHIDGVTAIYENNVLVTEITKKGYEHGYIFDVDLQENTVKIVLSWKRWVAGHKEETDFFKIRIVGETIYWKNTPKAKVPFEDGPIEEYAKFFMEGTVTKIESSTDHPEISIFMESNRLPIQNEMYPITSKGTTIGQLRVDWPLD